MRYSAIFHLRANGFSLDSPFAEISDDALIAWLSTKDLVTILSVQRMVTEGVITWSQVPFTRPAIDIVQFAVLITIGFFYRRKPAYHKRFMLLATIALLPAATGRMGYLLGRWSTEILFVVIVAFLFIYDVRKRGRPHVAYLMGTVILLPRILLELYWKFFLLA